MDLDYECVCIATPVVVYAVSSDGTSMEKREMSYPVLECLVRWLLACLPSSK